MMYRFEIYECGRVTLKTEEMSLEKAHDFYYAHAHTGHAIRLFIDDKPVPYLETTKKLKFNLSENFEVIENNQRFAIRKSDF